MAQDIISALLGSQPDFSSILSPQQSQQLRTNANLNAAIGAIIPLLGLSGPQARPVGTGQALGAALGGALGGYTQGFDRTLQQIVAAQQMEEMARKRQARELAAKAFKEETVDIPMATGPQSQLGMLADPMFGGGMADAETVAALRQNLPTKTTLDMDQFIKAISIIDPIEAAKLSQPKEGKLPPGKLGEYVEAKRLGEIPQSMTYEQFSKIGKEPLVKNIIGGEISPFEKKAQEKLAEDYVTVRESGRVARRALSDINRLESLLEKTETGFGASAKLAAGNLGITTKGLSELQAAEALINKLVPQQRPPGSGTMSDADLELYKRSVVRIINQPGANKIIIDSTKDINNYIVKEAEIANQVLNGKITREEADRKLAELGNPVQDFFRKNPSIIGGFPSTKGVRFLGFE